MTRSIVQFHSNGDDFARRLKAKAAEVERAGRRGLTIIGEDFVKRQKKEFALFAWVQYTPGLVKALWGIPRSWREVASLEAALERMCLATSFRT